MSDKTLCIAGKNNIAIIVAEFLSSKYPEYDLLAVCNATDNGTNGFQRSFKAYCELKGITIKTLPEVYGLPALIFLSLEFDKIVVPSRFATDRLFNIHFSLLPAYKGVYTSAWPILNAEKYTGVTFHKIDKGIDTGDIIAQTEILIGDETNGQQLYEKYIKHGAATVIENLPQILQGSFISQKQAAVGASYYSKSSIDYSALHIDLNKTAFEIYNQIRAFSFPAYQLPKILGTTFYRSQITGSKSQKKPGTILENTDFYTRIATVDYDLMLFKDRRTELLNNFMNNDAAGLQYFIDNGYDLWQRNEKGWDGLIVSVYNGHYDTAKRIISDFGWDINTTNYNGTTIPMYAMTRASADGEVSFLKYLKDEFELDWSRKDFYGFDIKYYAEKLNNKKVLDLL